MAVYRPKYKDPTTRKLVRSAVWWYEFTYVGSRIRESSKQTKKTLAIEAEKQRRKELEQSYAGIPSHETPKDRIRTVKGALATYGKSYAVNHREKSTAVVTERSKHLERLLGSLLMPDLTQERITAYMSERKTEGASNRTINMELGVLSRAVGQHFRVLWPKLKKLEERHDIGRALAPDEESRLIEAVQKNRSRLIGPFVRIALFTGMRRDEIRLLRWSQIDFEKKHITVGRAKTSAGRGRVIPIGPTLAAVLSLHADWFKAKFGAIEPDWFVFPFCRRAKPIDPARPVTTLRKAWGTVCGQAGIQCRIHDLRHTVCTKMAEAGVPEATMLDIMGHMSTAMLRRYSHIRQAAKVEAIEALEARSPFSNGVPKEFPKASEKQASKSAVTH
jgi:integrase